MAEPNRNPNICVIGASSAATREFAGGLEDAFDLVHGRMDDVASDDFWPQDAGVFVLVVTKGDNVAAQIRALERRSARVTSPIVVLTEHYDPETESTALAAGAVDCMPSTSPPSLLVARLQAHMDAHRFRCGDSPKSQALGPASGLYEAFFRHSPYFLSVHDVTGRYLDINPTAAGLLGARPADFIGKRPEQTPAAIGSPTRYDAFVRTRREPVVFERPVMTPDGERYTRVVTFPILDSQGGVRAIGRIAIDVSHGHGSEVAHRETLNALSRQDALFSAFMEHVPIMMSLQDLDGRYTMVNREVAMVIGRDVNEFLGRTDVELGCFSSETVEAAAAQVRKVIENREAVAEKRSVTYVGGRPTERWVTKFPVPDHAGSIFAVGTINIDLTAIAEAERALKEREQGFQALVEGSIQGIAIHRATRPLFINQAFVEIHGYACAEELFALGSLVETIAPLDRDRLREFGHQRASGETAPSHYEYRALKKNGSEIALQCVASTTVWEGAPAVQIAVNDITERKAAERQIDAYQAQLRRLASRVALAEEQERRRIATELHDGAVQNLGLAQIQLGRLLNALEGTEYAQRLAELRELIATSTRELRSLMSELSPPMLYELGLEPALDWLARRLGAQFGLECVVSVIDPPPRLADDRTVIVYQSVRELLINVVKHAEATRAEVELRRANAAMEVVVRDDGRGISPDRVQVRPSDAGGFGLFNLRERLRLLEGDLQIEADAGTRVTMRVPIE